MTDVIEFPGSREPYLEVTSIIDYDVPAVATLAKDLAKEQSSASDIIGRCFLWVRDEVSHSADAGASVVTCSACEVLRERTGICFAKSHLLAALLRANGIPTGFCYQRLSLDGGQTGPYCLHGYNAVWLDGRWFKIDARGNRADVDAQFNPPVEKLAFDVRPEFGEYEIPHVFAQPMPAVIQALQAACTLTELWATLPDFPADAPINI